MKLSEFIEFHARNLGSNPRALWQLAVSFRGYYGFPAGRSGRGGGAEATPRAITLLILACATSAVLRRPGDKIEDYYNASHEGSADRGAPRACPVCGEWRFGEALQRILENVDLAKQVDEIEIVRDWPEGVIRWKNGSKSQFVDLPVRGQYAVTTAPGSMLTESHVGGVYLVSLAEEIAGLDVPNREGWAHAS